MRHGAEWSRVVVSRLDNFLSPDVVEHLEVVEQFVSELNLVCTVRPIRVDLVLSRSCSLGGLLFSLQLASSRVP